MVLGARCVERDAAAGRGHELGQVRPGFLADLLLVDGDPTVSLELIGDPNRNFKIIMKDPKVKGILVNIFGGIMKCDVIAEGVLAAVRETNLAVPLVVRLEGTNAELGKKIIRESGLNVIPANDLDDAAQKIVAAVKGK